MIKKISFWVRLAGWSGLISGSSVLVLYQYTHNIMFLINLITEISYNCRAHKRRKIYISLATADNIISPCSRRARSVFVPAAKAANLSRAWYCRAARRLSRRKIRLQKGNCRF